MGMDGEDECIGIERPSLGISVSLHRPSILSVPTTISPPCKPANTHWSSNTRARTERLAWTRCPMPQSDWLETSWAMRCVERGSDSQALDCSSISEVLSESTVCSMAGTGPDISAKFLEFLTPSSLHVNMMVWTRIKRGRPNPVKLF